ncbi:hypothetical protein D3OALGA1CA_2325 [Olavius algarvensis associated proteobacterium Delta 3]|nr:hypothetical protein D3OALGB2SA_226 [Olavius algarvensis associated proteobacterium Delta 3]CAB5116953.1 hypothetical protein D3OALGA1CA_2325 [Olavius algarvensis associated proteobacterium Delta 3]
MAIMNGLLFIDDEEGVRRSVSRALRKEPYEMFTAGDGRTAIAFLERHVSKIAMVISDFKMPDMDGLETLCAIGRINPEITRIILTGYATMEAAIAATNEGIDGFLTKPFDNIELRAKIREISVRKRLRQFISERIYREIDSSRGILAPKYHEVTVLFCDIRGFTAMSQQVSPESLVAFLNDHYFSPLGEIAHGFDGTVDKHIGDSIMVVFGSPAPRDNDALRAVRAGVAMQQKATEINEKLRIRKAFRLHIGIGISSGEVFSGVLGSLRKKEFTSIGMPVNIAARLQGLAGPGEILISRSTFQKIQKEISATPMPPVCVKGLEAPISTYRVHPSGRSI